MLRLFFKGTLHARRPRPRGHPGDVRREMHEEERLRVAVAAAVLLGAHGGRLLPVQRRRLAVQSHGANSQRLPDVRLRVPWMQCKRRLVLLFFFYYFYYIYSLGFFIFILFPLLFILFDLLTLISTFNVVHFQLGTSCHYASD